MYIIRLLIVSCGLVCFLYSAVVNTALVDPKYIGFPFKRDRKMSILSKFKRLPSKVNFQTNFSGNL